MAHQSLNNNFFLFRYAEVLLPAPLARIEENTDLRYTKIRSGAQQIIQFYCKDVSTQGFQYANIVRVSMLALRDSSF